MRMHDHQGFVGRSLLYTQFGAGSARTTESHLVFLSRFRLLSGVARWDFLLEVDGRLASTSIDSTFGVVVSLLTRPEFARNFLIGASLTQRNH